MTKTSDRSTRRFQLLRTSQAPRLRLLLLALALASSTPAGLSAQLDPDLKGSRDHPMISRVEGSRIASFNQKEFDEYRLVRGTVGAYSKDGNRWKDLEEALNEENSLRLEGKVWRLTYEIPKNRSTLEIIRSYQAELTKAGFKILYQCANRECAGPPPKPNLANSSWFGALSELLMKRGGFNVYGSFEDNQRYLAARLARAAGDVYVSVLALEVRSPHARLDVIEVKPLTSSLVTVNAATMATDISTRGSVALYGIYFDNDRAEVKPESRPTLSEIATLLKQNGKLELIVVGHTDNNGTLDHNLDLSRRRAEAVVSALASEFGWLATGSKPAVSDSFHPWRLIQARITGQRIGGYSCCSGRPLDPATATRGAQANLETKRKAIEQVDGSACQAASLEARPRPARLAGFAISNLVYRERSLNAQDLPPLICESSNAQHSIDF